MSHFAVMVIGPNVEQQLAPFHEFECTGTVDQYVQTIDKLEELKAEYESSSRTMMRGPAGELVATYDDIFYRDPTPEEKDKIGLGSGFGGGLSWTSKDWGDGLGYRAKINFVPEGWQEVDIPVKEFMTLIEYLKYQTSDEFPILNELEDTDLHDRCKWGWARVNASGELIEFTNRTNADKYIWTDNFGKEIATSYGDADLPFMLKNPNRGGEFLPDSAGRLVHLLQGLHEAEQQIKAYHGTASQVAHQGNVWDYGERVPGLDAETELFVRDLLDAFGNENRWIFSGSLSLDREGQRATLRELQFFARACKRRNIHFVGCDKVSGAINKQCVSGAKWDWWQLGGRYSGWLKLKPGASGESGRKGLMGSCMNDGAGLVDSALKRDIDFDGMREKDGNDAAAKWDKAAAAKVAVGLAADATWDSWDTVRARHPDAIDAARDEYHAQPALKAVKEALDNPFYGVDDLMVSREQFIKQARDRALVTYALIKDGQWYAKGEMGWFGTSTDDMTQDEWNQKVNEMIDGLPDDTQITIVDCHI